MGTSTLQGEARYPLTGATVEKLTGWYGLRPCRASASRRPKLLQAILSNAGLLSRVKCSGQPDSNRRSSAPEGYLTYRHTLYML